MDTARFMVSLYLCASAQGTGLAMRPALFISKAGAMKAADALVSIGKAASYRLDNVRRLNEAGVTVSLFDKAGYYIGYVMD